MSELALKFEHEAPLVQAALVGEVALWGAGVFKHELGVNDPLTHLEQYLEHGEAAMPSIDEDLITDIAERKLQPTFVNEIVFDRVGGDFVSRENKFSMRDMTQITENKFSRGGIADMEQYKRAKIEALEVVRLNDWFGTARIGDFFVVESLPLGNERYSIVRAYEKTDEDELKEHVITLHNATVGTFNRMHLAIGAEVPDSQTELELLDGMYAYSPAESDFIDNYVAAHDRILAQQNPGREYKFGLPLNKDDYKGDDIENVRRQTVLRSVYLDTLKTLGKSGGRVTPGIIKASAELGCNFTIYEGDAVSGDIARELLNRSLQSVAATFNRATKAEMDALAASQDIGLAAGYAGHYGGEARAEGVTYNGACPSSSLSPAQAEANAVNQARRANQEPSQCGTCPNCKKEYFVDNKIYKKKILECNNCHEAIRFGGGKVSKAELAKIRGQKSKSEVGVMDGIMLALEKDDLSYKIKRLAQRQTMPLSKFEERRSKQLLFEYSKRLESIKYLTS